MLYNLEDLGKKPGKKKGIESRVSNIEGKVDTILAVNIIEFIGFIGLVITLISKI